MRRPIVLVSFASLAGLAAAYSSQCVVATTAAVAIPACSNNDAGGVTPITGIEIRSEALIAGHGCGTGPDQIFKYVAVVKIPAEAGAPAADGGIGSAYVAAGVSDCYADLTFSGLCTYVSNGTNGSSYDVDVYAYNAAEWSGVAPDAGEPSDAGTDAPPADAAVDGSLGAAPDATAVPTACATDPRPPSVAIPADIPDNGRSICTPDAAALNPSDLECALRSSATWRTTCTATQQSDIAVLALCNLPLTKR